MAPKPGRLLATFGLLLILGGSAGDRTEASPQLLVDPGSPLDSPLSPDYSQRVLQNLVDALGKASAGDVRLAEAWVSGLDPGFGGGAPGIHLPPPVILPKIPSGQLQVTVSTDPWRGTTLQARLGALAAQTEIGQLNSPALRQLGISAQSDLMLKALPCPEAQILYAYVLLLESSWTSTGSSAAVWGSYQPAGLRVPRQTQELLAATFGDIRLWRDPENQLMLTFAYEDFHYAFTLVQPWLDRGWAGLGGRGLSVYPTDPLKSECPFCTLLSRNLPGE